MNDKKTNIRWTVAALMMGLLLAALDQTIISTAMPTIVSELGELDKFIWVFSAYMIASVSAMPIFGKMSDMYGRKLFFLAGLVVFMIGSALCGTANSMLELIIYRAIQGIGGGALMPVTFTIIYDIFPPEKRGKMQGLFGAVFGLSSVLGPLAGAYFTDYISWRWIFYINLPLGIVSLLLLARFYFESLEHKKQKIDWLGTLLLIGSILCLMFALELGGKEFSWSSWQIIGLFGGFAVLLGAFLYAETKVSDPVVPLSLFKNRLFAASQGVSFFYGAVMIAGASYIPLFVQGVFGGSASNAGFVLTPMMLGIVASSTIGGRFVGKTAYRNIMLVSVTLLMAAVILLSTISVDTSRLLVTLYMIFAGLGLGTSFPVISMSALHNIEFKQRGIVNSLVAFFRTIGSAIGVTVLGVIQINYLKDKLLQALPDSEKVQQLGDGRALLQPEVRNSIPEEVLHKMITALADSISLVFQWSLLFVVLAAVFIFFMGKAKLETAGKSRKAA